MNLSPKLELRQATLLLMTCGLVSILSGCSAATWQGIGGAASGMAAGMNGTGMTIKLMLFGGPGHQTYLGCLNCNQYASDSMFNPYGLHGSPYGLDSVANHYSEYGSQYSTYSACSLYATDPPVIVDSNGAFYGRLTLNQYHPQKSQNGQLLAWLAAMCNE